MTMACFCFGCKGAGQALKVAAAGAVVATQVVGAVVQPSQSSGGEGDGVQAPGDPQGASEGTAPHAQCVELAPMPEEPGDVVAVRTVDCGGRVLVQDAETGLWRDRR